MKEILNASNLFERRGGEESLPGSSESFWTTVFGLFLLHLGKSSEKEKELLVWQCKNPPAPPWYEPASEPSTLNVAGLGFADLAVEPKAAVTSRFLDSLVNISVDLAGIEPDLLLRLHPSGPKSKGKFVFIENKTAGCLQSNQEENYPQLMNYLNDKGIESEFFLLMSAGAKKKLYEQANRLQQQRCNKFRFGLLLWEDVLQQMKKKQFQLPGIDIDGWQKYAEPMPPDVYVD